MTIRSWLMVYGITHVNKQFIVQWNTAMLNYNLIEFNWLFTLHLRRTSFWHKINTVFFFFALEWFFFPFLLPSFLRLTNINTITCLWRERTIYAIHLSIEFFRKKFETPNEFQWIMMNIKWNIHIYYLILEPGTRCSTSVKKKMVSYSIAINSKHSQATLCLWARN